MKDENSCRKYRCFIDGSYYIFDTHAHYFHRRFANMPDGMDRVLFDKPEYEWIYYAHGSHPKYLWKEVDEWNGDRWKEYEELLSDGFFSSRVYSALFSISCFFTSEYDLEYIYPYIAFLPSRPFTYLPSHLPSFRL